MTDRELDALVAEKVMGWNPWLEQRGEYTHVVWQKPGEREPYRRSRDWEAQKHRFSRIDASQIDGFHHINHLNAEFSTSIADAWLVVERMRELGWQSEILYGRAGATVEMVRCSGPDHYEGYRESDDSAPRAISLAALKALGVEVEG